MTTGLGALIWEHVVRTIAALELAPGPDDGAFVRALANETRGHAEPRFRLEGAGYDCLYMVR
jgi:hypothetical protein